MSNPFAVIGPKRGSAWPPRPTAPKTIQESGLTTDLVTQLTLKTLYFFGELSGSDLAKRMGLIFSVIEPSLDFLKAQRHCEVIGGAILGGSSYRYRITTEGRVTATLYLQHNQYVGPAPVPLAQYKAYLGNLQASGPIRVTRPEVARAYSHLVLSDSVIDEIGPAVNGRHSIFIYGPPGNGKTAIARGIRQLLDGPMAIPYAIEVEGSIIRVFDPVNHQEQTVEADDGLAVTSTLDGRWVMCRRPMLAAGGELTLEALDLNYDPKLGYYRAPVQLAANGGLLVIDDFGRQHCAPSDLLNRWMVPLENGIDYLTLQSGLKFEVPFLVFIAFATNINPAQLVDEAFLRRVQYKVFAASPSREQYLEIFERSCRERNLTYTPAVAEYLLDSYYPLHAIAPRGCHPRDLINQALLLADYRGESRALTIDLIEAACTGYFVSSRMQL
jgi:predicted ATPase with chaperone activity